MKKIIFLVSVFVSLYANTCNDKLFSLSAYESSGSSVRVKDVLKEISVKCNISISFLDTKSKKAINKKLDFVNIKDYTFDDFLSFLFDQANLFYTFNKEKNYIEVMYTKTETFSIDYVNAVLKSSSTKTINSGSASSTMGNSNTNGGSTNNTYGTNGYDATQQGSASSPSMDITEMVTESEFTFWDNLKSNISNLFDDKENTKIFLNKDASLLTVCATKQDIKKVKKYLDTLMKKMHKQVLIEAKIIELIYDDSSVKGVDWSQLKLSLSGSLSNNVPLDGSDFTGTVIGSYTKPMYKLSWNFSTDKFINFLDRYGDVKVLSNPKVLTLNNQPAVINVGEQLSYKYQTGSVTTTGGTAAGTNTYSLGSTFVGITLYVIPEVSSNNEIIMKINPVISRLANENDQTDSQTNRELPPDVKVKQLTSIVKVRNNEKVLIGGLISVVKSNYDNRIPVLGYVPGLDRLFGQNTNLKTRSEMFIILVPKVVGADNMPTMEDMAFEKIFEDEKKKNEAK